MANSGNNEKTSLLWQRDTQTVRNTALGLLLAIGGAFLLLTSAACIQPLNNVFPDMELNVVRCVVTPALFALLKVKQGCNASWMKIERSDILWVLLFSLTNIASTALEFAGAYRIGIGTSFCVYLGTSLVCFWILNALILKEVKLHSLFGVVVAIVGMFFVIQPSKMFNQETDVNITSHIPWNCLDHCSASNDTIKQVISDNFTSRLFLKSNNTYLIDGNVKGISQTSIGILASLFAGMFVSVGGMIGNLRIKHVDSISIGFWYTVPGIPIFIVLMLVFETPIFPSCWLCIVLLFVHTLSYSFSTMSWVFIIKLADPAIIQLVASAVTLTIGSLLQNTLLSSIFPGYQNTSEYIGFGLCFLSVIVGPTCELWIIKKKSG